MNCPTCENEMHELGCQVSGSPLHWCPYCGTIKPCDETRPVVPEFYRAMSHRIIRPLTPDEQAQIDAARREAESHRDEIIAEGTRHKEQYDANRNP